MRPIAISSAFVIGLFALSCGGSDKAPTAPTPVTPTVEISLSVAGAGTVTELESINGRIPDFPEQCSV